MVAPFNGRNPETLWPAAPETTVCVRFLGRELILRRRSGLKAAFSKYRTDRQTAVKNGDKSDYEVEVNCPVSAYMTDKHLTQPPGIRECL